MRGYQDFRNLMSEIGAYMGGIKLGDVVEILLVAILVYYILAWMKTTRSWRLMKGVIVIGIFLVLAAAFQMTTITWLAKNIIPVAVTGAVVILQPEIRDALEKLGQNKFFFSIGLSNFGNSKESLDETHMNEIIRACKEMSAVKTGALIVIEKTESLREYERTGIQIDGKLSSQLLVNIFEHNTPLHDGAVIVRGNRIISATCYLPLSGNQGLSKELGTRHRAGVGISEVTDSLTVIVSEESGSISLAYEGELKRDLTEEEMREKISQIMNISVTNNVKAKYRWKGRVKVRNEKKDSE